MLPWVDAGHRRYRYRPALAVGPFNLDMIRPPRIGSWRRSRTSGRSKRENDEDGRRAVNAEGRFWFSIGLGALAVLVFLLFAWAVTRATPRPATGRRDWLGLIQGN